MDGTGMVSRRRELRLFQNVYRSVLSRVTRAVTLMTESFGKPETAAGRKTLPGMAARAVLDVITAAMVVFSRGERMGGELVQVATGLPVTAGPLGCGGLAGDPLSRVVACGW